MAELKTKQTDESVKKFLDAIESETKREDGYALLKLMEQATGFPAKMWGPSIIGFGSYHYKYTSGHEGDAPLAGFSPRKQSISVYLMPGFDDIDTLLAKLGKHKMGKGCLYINKLSDVDTSVITQLVKSSMKFARETYP